MGILPRGLKKKISLLLSVLIIVSGPALAVTPVYAAGDDSEPVEYRPFIEEISENMGPISGGTEVIIWGFNFTKSSGDDEGVVWDAETGPPGAVPVQVLFNGVEQVIISARDGRIVIRTVALTATGDFEQDIVVVNKKSGLESAVFAQGFKYTTDEIIEPQITSFSPHGGGGAGGTRVTIAGEDFHTVKGDDDQPLYPTVYFGANKVTKVISCTLKEIVVEAPPHWAGGFVNIRVENPRGGGHTYEDERFFYRANQATIGKVEPPLGPLGTIKSFPIRIQGQSFPYTELGTEEALKAKIKESLKGTELAGWDVVSVQPELFFARDIPFLDLKFASETELLAYIPEQGPGGRQDVTLKVTIKLKRNDAGKEMELVEVSTLAGAFELVEDWGAPQILRVENPDPKLREVSPHLNIGPLGGKIEVHIIGKNLAQGMEFYFGDHEEAAKFIRSYINREDNTDVHVVELPANPVAGAVTVRGVMGGETRCILPWAFTYRNTTMSIANVSPREGPVDTKVTITGANFDLISHVYFGDIEATIDAEKTSEKSITVRVNDSPITGAPVPVRLIDPFGSCILEKAFTYLFSDFDLDLVGIRPNWAEQDGGQIVFIESRREMVLEPHVYFGDTAAGDVRFMSKENISPRELEGIEWLEEDAPYVLRVVVPAGKAGLTTVTVENIDGASEKLPFYYRSKPLINSISPGIASIYGGNVIDIKGENFLTEADAAILTSTDPKIYALGEELFSDFTIKVGDIEVTEWEETEEGLAFRIPPKVGGQGEYAEGMQPLEVTNADGGKVILAQAIDFVYPGSRPAISKFTPKQGIHSGGTNITITGENYDGPKLYLGLRQAEITESSPISIQGLTPPTSLSRADENRKVAVTVVNADGAVVIAADDFEYMFPDAGLTVKINRVYPQNILSANKNPVTIEGQGFQAGLDILVGYDKVDAEDYSIYDSRGNIVAATEDGLGVLIEFLTPRLAAGSYDVTVVNPDTSLARAPRALTANLRETRPDISQIIPARGPNSGSEVDIIGHDFREGAMVYFGNKLAEVKKIELIDNELGVITVQTPPQAPGKKDVLLVNPDGASCSKKEAFEYLDNQDSIPRIRAIQPLLGDVAGGTRLQIFGQDFYGGENGEVEVYVGYKRATQNLEVKDIDNNGYGKEISVLTPPNEAGTYDIKVYNPDGASFILRDAFTYKEIKDYPTIAALEPSVGPLTGGIWVVVEGSGFKEGMEVFFADREAKDIIIQSPSRMRVKVPRGEGPGLVDVIVINAAGGSAILEKGFEYVSISPEDAPKIDSVIPSVGRTSGSTRVSISGSKFQPGAAIFFGSQPAATVEFVSAQHIYATTPPQGAGVVELTIVNPDGGSYILPRAFTYIEKGGPIVKGITPSSGDTGGGLRVVVSGENFDEGALVYFDGEKATSIAQEEGRLIVETPPHDPGLAAVRVVNPDGTEGTLAAAFTYFGPPRPPRDLSVQVIDDNTILLSWQPVVGARGYEIYGRRYNYDDLEFMGGTPETYFYVTGLRRDSRYYFEIRAVNEYGLSLAVERVSGRTSDKGGAGTTWWYSSDDSLYQEGDKLTVILKEAAYGAKKLYHLDLRDAKYRKVKEYTINIPAAAVERTGTLVVETQDVRLQFPLSLWARAGLKNLTYRERQESYGRIVLARLDGWEGDLLQSLLPAGTRPLSPPYRLEGQVQLGRQVKDINSFSPRLQLSLTRTGGISTATEKAGLYYYDPARDAWREENNYAGRSSPTVMGEVTRPGVYRALARKLN